MGVRTEDQARKVAQYFLSKNPHVLDAILRWHEFRDYGCTATSDGELCCIDELLGSTEPSA